MILDIIIFLFTICALCQVSLADVPAERIAALIKCVALNTDREYVCLVNEAGTLVISPKYDTSIDTANKDKMLFYCLQTVGKGIDAEIIGYYEDYEQHFERTDFSVEEALAIADRHITLLPEETEDLSKYNIIFNSTVRKRDGYYFALPSDTDKACVNLDLIPCHESTCYNRWSAYQSVRAMVGTCDYIQFAAWPHHNCEKGNVVVRAA